MKNKITAIRGFNYLTVLFLSFSVLFISPQFVLAQTTISSGISSSIKYLGAEGNHVVFHLEIDNKAEEPYTVRIKDEYGNLLFYKTIKERRISKRFHFNKDEIGELVTFIVNSKKEQKIETYQVDRNIRIVEDVVVRKQ